MSTTPFLNSQKAQIDYPCVWQYKLIGMDRQAVRAAVAVHLGDAPYSLSDSRRSGAGKYISMNLEVSVDSEDQRLRWHQVLATDPSVKLVL
uniref:HP0495 family protein n=1 Tax=Candidatus Electronema sp. TaxID=2698783 RepID=UPI004057210F